jgi:hypothetical protein
MEAIQTNYVTCKCQNCDGGIEFDASNFAQGETCTIDCPHCHLETIIFAPPSRAASLSPTNRTVSSSPNTASPFTAIVLWTITGVLFLIRLGLCHSNSAANAVILIIFFSLIVAAITTSKYRTRKNLLIHQTKKTASPRMAIVLWVTTVVLFVVGLAVASSGSEAGDVFLLMICFLIAAAIATGNYRNQKNLLNPPKPKWICANCGTLLIWPGRESICGACGQNSVIPLGTPRGGELFAIYHGAVTAKERVEIGDEATKKLLRSLEPILASGSLALELEKLAGLVRTGAITTDEWQRAKALYLGQPQAGRENSLGRVQQLYDLCQSGALSESEFNMVKWDILSKGMS